MVPVFYFVDAWCFFCQKRFFVPELPHAYTCAKCRAKN